MVQQQREDEPGLRFTQADTEKRSWTPWLVAGAVILLGLAVLIAVSGHRGPASAGSGPGLAAPDAYAGNLTLSNIRMSEAGNFAGGKVTYLDGQVANRGSETLNAITVQVAFHNALDEIAQKETMPLALIRTRDPYVDTQPISASPLKPGDQRDFRLIFDTVTPDWNQQYPEVRIIQVAGSYVSWRTTAPTVQSR